MPQVDFYHLTRTPVETVLPKLLEKILAGGGRALVVAEDAALLARLDDQLWRYDPSSFLPHARFGTGDEADQPVLLSERAAAENGAQFLLVADGRWPDGADAFERVSSCSMKRTLLAPGPNGGVLSLAKRYWKQDGDGRWVEGP